MRSMVKYNNWAEISFARKVQIFVLFGPAVIA